jgi:hypothetical protein
MRNLTGKITCILILLISALSCRTSNNKRIFTELVFIDHQNLRYVKEKQLMLFQIESAKKNIDKASELGIDTYLFFAQETFEAMLNYDFTVSGLGNIGEKAFPPDGDHRRTAIFLRDALNEIIDYAQKRHVRIFFHSNQFIFPKEVLKIIEPAVWGTAVCPGRHITWEIYRNKLQEFLTLFPNIAGLQITGDETQVSVLECKCDSCSHMSFVDRVNMLTRITAEVCQAHGKEVQMRTWQRMAELEEEKDPTKMGEGLPDNVFFSIKNTKGDFYITNPPDEKFLRSSDPDRVVVEFDAWQEYNGNNYFPCFMGEKWAPRFRLLHELGIKRIAIRLNWCSNKNPIFEMPWGNEVNIYTFLKLSENPERTADDILQEFVLNTFPESAQKAAFDLYKFSPGFQETIYYLKGEYNANHSRVQDDYARIDLENLQNQGLLVQPGDFEARRQEINTACKKANSLVDLLGIEVPEKWIKSLKTGIIIEQHIAIGTIDKMEAIFWKKKGNTEEFEKVLKRLRERQKNWSDFHPESYQSMNGEDLLRDI